MKGEEERGGGERGEVHVKGRTKADSIVRCLLLPLTSLEHSLRHSTSYQGHIDRACSYTGT